MKNTNLAIGVILLLIMAFLQPGCSKEKPSDLKSEKLVLPEEAFSYNLQDLPPYARFSGWDIDNNVATLGRVLFYDKVLSVNNSVSCASCHKQNIAFSDNVAFSKGFTGKNTTRNSMAIINPAGANGFFWDVRETNLKAMVTKPVQNHIEMGFDSVYTIVGKINNLAYYKPLFKNAFGNDEVNVEKIQEALMQFLTSMTTYNARFDEGMKDNFRNYTAKEKLGKELFTETLHCNNCHTAPMFSAEWMVAANIGLDEEYTDQGMGNGMFKIPSLRNVSLTAPYMHDGRFKTLEEVVEHYNSGVKLHQNLDWSMRDFDGININTAEARKLNLNQHEKEALVAFLHTLTDFKFINDPKYSNPFRNN